MPWHCTEEASEFAPEIEIIPQGVHIPKFRICVILIAFFLLLYFMFSLTSSHLYEFFYEEATRDANRFVHGQEDMKIDTLYELIDEYENLIRP